MTLLTCPKPAPASRPIVQVATHAAPYPIHCLAGLGPAVNAAHEITQAPVAIAAQTALSLASLAVQGLANVETLGGYRPTSLFCLTIARSGERKSTVDGLLSGNLDDYGCTVSDATANGLFRVLKDSPSSGLISDEAGVFLGGYAMSKGKSAQTLSNLNVLWDGKRISKVTAKDSISLRGRRLAIHLSAQPEVMRQLLSDPLAESIGFLPRCLIVEPESTIGTRTYAQPTPEARQAVEAFHNRLHTLLSLDLPITDPERMDLTPRQLRLSDKARTRLTWFANLVEKAQRAGGRYETIPAIASKTAEQAARIAGVLTLWRDEQAEEVDELTMLMAACLAKYYTEEAVRLMSVTRISTDLQCAETLRVWLMNRPSKEFVTGDVQQSGPRSARKNATRSLEILLDHGCIERLPDGHELNGSARRSGWRLV